jgi:hypothetical protein
MDLDNFNRLSLNTKLKIFENPAKLLTINQVKGLRLLAVALAYQWF